MTDEKIQIVFSGSPTMSELSLLTQGISLEAKIKKSQKEIIPYAFFLKNAQNEIKGGINGCLLYGCLTIDQLFVDESLRENRFGSTLMQMAHSFGKDNQCRFATVNTMDWEAKDFYIKLGYVVEFQREGYDNDSVFYFLKKAL